MKKNKIKLLLSCFMVSSMAIISTPLLINGITTKSSDSDDSSAPVEPSPIDEVFPVNTSPGWHELPKYGTTSFENKTFQESNDSLKNGGQFSVTDFGISANAILITDFPPLQSTSQFNQFMNENWMNIFTWEKDYWNSEDSAGMRTDFVVQYSISEDQRAVSINLKWRNNSAQYWYCDFNIMGFMKPTNNPNANGSNANSSKSGLQWWGWMLIILAIVAVIAAIVTTVLLLKKKKDNKKKAQLAHNRQRQIAHNQQNRIPHNAQREETQQYASGYSRPSAPANRQPSNGMPPRPTGPGSRPGQRLGNGGYRR